MSDNITPQQRLKGLNSKTLKTEWNDGEINKHGFDMTRNVL